MLMAVTVSPAALQYRSEVRPEVQPDGSIVYLAEFPDLPGCMSHGATVEEARRNLEDAKIEYLAALQEQGLEIPAPSIAPCVGGVTWVVLSPAPREDAAQSTVEDMPTAMVQPLDPEATPTAA
ncbi:MAG: type II toxin-antitoxin system HicB family antitoxin [Candidatus Rokubacteria bacterium]|nr:type II toxin-antitoxin system HicB family antitoxin [Candidatus Rokubacteria bacterium]